MSELTALDSGLRFDELALDARGARFRAGGVEVRTSLRGRFNVENVLGAVAAARRVADLTVGPAVTVEDRLLLGREGTFGDELEVTSRVFQFGGGSVLTLHRLAPAGSGVGRAIPRWDSWISPAPVSSTRRTSHAVACPVMVSSVSRLRSSDPPLVAQTHPPALASHCPRRYRRLHKISESGRRERGSQYCYRPGCRMLAAAQAEFKDALNEHRKRLWRILEAEAPGGDDSTAGAGTPGRAACPRGILGQ